MPRVYTQQTQSKLVHAMCSDVKILAYTGCMWAAGHAGGDGTHHPVIGVKGVGKDTVAGMVANHVHRLGRGQVVHLSFADPLKECVANHYGLPQAVYDCAAMKDQPLPQYPGWTYRRFLETVGTDVGRHLCPGLFVQHLRARIQHMILERTLGLPAAAWSARCREVGLPESRASPWVLQITDLRFKNEYDMLKALGATVVQVSRTAPAEHTRSSHVSNCFDASIVPDVCLANDGSLHELDSQVSQWVAAWE